MSMLTPWHKQMDASMKVGESQDPEVFPIFTTTFPQMTSEQALGKPLGTGGSCRLKCLIVGASMGVRCLISRYSHQGAN